MPKPKADPRTANGPQVLSIQQQPDESEADAVASKSLRPTVQAALTLMDYNKNFGELSINRLVNDLSEQCEKSFDGDLRRAEALLVTQAHTLDAIFHRLARKANNCEYLNQLDVNLRLALRAQNQCRATLETLAEIKNPLAGAYVRQANVAGGHQQVNNTGTSVDAASRARKIAIPPFELSRGKDELHSNTGAPPIAGPDDPPMETLGEFDRPKINGR